MLDAVTSSASRLRPISFRPFLFLLQLQISSPVAVKSLQSMYLPKSSSTGTARSSLGTHKVTMTLPPPTSLRNMPRFSQDLVHWR